MNRALQGLTDLGTLGELPKVMQHAGYRARAAARATHTASPTLASPSVNMMIMECSSLRLYAPPGLVQHTDAPQPSASLMLVTGTQTEAP